jgi:hypothetical protein
MIGSDRGRLTSQASSPPGGGPVRIAGGRETARTRSPIVLDCPTVDLVFPLIRRLVYENVSGNSFALTVLVD